MLTIQQSYKVTSDSRCMKSYKMINKYWSDQYRSDQTLFLTCQIQHMNSGKLEEQVGPTCCFPGQSLEKFSRTTPYTRWKWSLGLSSHLHRSYPNTTWLILCCQQFLSKKLILLFFFPWSDISTLFVPVCLKSSASLEWKRFKVMDKRHFFNQHFLFLKHFFFFLKAVFHYL